MCGCGMCRAGDVAALRCDIRMRPDRVTHRQTSRIVVSPGESLGWHVKNWPANRISKVGRFRRAAAACVNAVGPAGSQARGRMEMRRQNGTQRDWFPASRGSISHNGRPNHPRSWSRCPSSPRIVLSASPAAERASTSPASTSVSNRSSSSADAGGRRDRKRSNGQLTSSAFTSPDESS